MERRTFVKIAAVAAASTLLGGASSAFADEAVFDKVEFTAERAKGYADEFVSSITRDVGITTGAPIRLCSADRGNHIGYVVPFFRRGNPNGYVTLDADAPGLVYEFSLDEGTAGPCASLQPLSRSLSLEEEVLYRRNALEYAIDNDGMLVNGRGDIVQETPKGELLLNQDDSGSPGSTTWGNVLIDSYYPSYSISDIQEFRSVRVCESP